MLNCAVQSLHWKKLDIAIWFNVLLLSGLNLITVGALNKICAKKTCIIFF